MKDAVVRARIDIELKAQAAAVLKANDLELSDAIRLFLRQVVRRGQDVVHLRSVLTPDEVRQGFQAVRPGERIVTAGAVELKAALEDLQRREDR